MKKILTAILMTFPYLFVLFAYLIFNIGKFEQGDLWGLLIMTIIMSVLLTVSYIVTLAFIIFRWDCKTSLFINLLIKISYIPVHCVLLILTMGFSNPFLLILMPVPFIISVAFLLMTGTIFTISQIKFYLKFKSNLAKTIIYSLLSYFYVLDIVVAIIVYLDARKMIKLGGNK